MEGKWILIAKIPIISHNTQLTYLGIEPFFKGKYPAPVSFGADTNLTLKVESNTMYVDYPGGASDQIFSLNKKYRFIFKFSNRLTNIFYVRICTSLYLIIEWRSVVDNQNEKAESTYAFRRGSHLPDNWREKAILDVLSILNSLD